MSAMFWAGLLPIGIVALAIAGRWTAWLLAAATLSIALYAVLLARMYIGSRRLGRSSGDSWLYSVFCLIAKWPQLQGSVRYWMGR